MWDQPHAQEPRRGGTNTRQEAQEELATPGSGHESTKPAYKRMSGMMGNQMVSAANSPSSPQSNRAIKDPILKFGAL
jgi:hypothetical protein